MNFSEVKNKLLSNELIRYAILAYWSLFWFFNSLDKIIGGSQFLWVGRDRFAQFQKFFASAGMDSPLIANVALIIAAALEVFAFVFFTGALIHYFKKNQESARSWFFIGIILSLITFTIFAIGDHIFGDRFELLEHTLFWFLTIFTWVIYKRIDQVNPLQESVICKKQLTSFSVVTIVLIAVTCISIFSHNESSFYERTAAVDAEPVGENRYKFSFPFLGGSTAFENSLERFLENNPTKKINFIYTAPNELRLQKADGLIMYVLTEDKE